MVQLDYQLLHQAHCLITGANVHRLKEMIFVYVQAVELHNRDWPSHQEYQPEHEARLRRYVTQDRLKRLDQVERERAKSLIDRSARLHQRSEEQARHQEWRPTHAA